MRVWALGRPLLAKPTLADAPLVEVTAEPAKPFSLELPDDALPVRVEVAAAGDIGAAFTVALPEQTALPPLWLPAGRELRLRVVMDNKPAAGAHVWGLLQGVNRVDDAGRWQPVVPTTEVDGKGQANVRVPTNGTVTLSGRGPDGRWGTSPPIRLPTPGTRVLRLDWPTTVVVRNPRGEPVVGILVADRNAPTGGARATDQKGKATVQAAGTGEIEIVALGMGYVGTLVKHTLPPGEPVLALEPAHELTVQRPGTRNPLLLEPAWIPSPLRGGRPCWREAGGH